MPSSTVNTPRMKIQDIPLIPAINGTEKIPTGGFGDYAVSINQLRTYIGGGSGGGGSTRLIDLTDVIATTPTVGKFLRELPTVNSVRRFGFEDISEKPFVVGNWDMRPTSSVTYSVTAGAAIIDGALSVINRPSLPVDESTGAFYMTARAALVPPLNIKITVPTRPFNVAWIGIHRNSISILDQLATLQTGGTPTDTLLYASSSPSVGYQALLTVNGTTDMLNNAVVEGEISLSISADYVLTIAGQTFQLTQQSCEAFSIVSYGLDRDSVGDIALSAYAVDGASIPTGAKDGDVFRVTHGGNFKGQVTKTGDYITLIDDLSELIITRIPTEYANPATLIAMEEVARNAAITDAINAEVFNRDQAISQELIARRNADFALQDSIEYQAIRINQLIQGGGGGSGNTSYQDTLVSLFLTATANKIPLNTVQSFSDAASVVSLFGSNSVEARIARIHFDRVNKTKAYPTLLYIANYVKSNINVLVSGELTVPENQISDWSGSMQLNIDGVSYNSGMDLRGVRNYAALADRLNSEFSINNVSLVNGRLVVRGNPNVDYAFGSLAGVFKLTQATGATIEQQIAPTTLIAQLEGIVASYPTWNTITPLFDLDESEKAALNTWLAGKYGSYHHVQVSTYELADELTSLLYGFNNVMS